MTGTDPAAGSHDVQDRRTEYKLEPDEGFH